MKDEASDIPGMVPHPDLKRLADEGHDLSAVIALTGYLGAAPHADMVRLYRGLEDLSVSIDISRGDILKTTDAPTSTMPLGGVIVWVARTAEVTFRRTRTVSTTAGRVRDQFGAGLAVDTADTGRVVDRLDIQLGPQFRGSSSSGYSPNCYTCRSQCFRCCKPLCDWNRPK
ncbi:hypothetical protein [Nocardia neocaledoniensis]|uniref:hypothetical protein n=1 Tax=Nocardia neocaledoniensis TaxID=236511 RepID=UPI0024575B05|nr:hypothetical protein [Nocardia neocaledoniensis]